MTIPPFKSFGTDAVHAGNEPDADTGAVILPIGVSTTFKQISPGVPIKYEYSRCENPTRNALETAVAKLEDGKHGFAYSSGSATTANIVMSFLKEGDHVVCMNDLYGGTNRYFQQIAKKSGISCSFVDMKDPKNVEDACRSNTEMVWCETPTNPTLSLVDIAAVAKICKKFDIIFVVDNTFMSPYFQRPLTLGADIVMHSGTKYLNGHSDVIIGLAVTRSDELAEKLRFHQNAIGAVPSPFDCFLTNRGLKTLHIRCQAHQKNALAVARFLESHSNVEKVLYPGLASHPQHPLACKQMTGFGGMVSFYIMGNLYEARRFLENLELITLAESLGGIESLAELPSVMTHSSLTSEERESLGITDTLIRLSVGIENSEDLINDLDQALNK